MAKGEIMQNSEMILDSHLEVLKDRILHKEDCEKIMAQIGILCNPQLVPCRVIKKKLKFTSLEEKK